MELADAGDRARPVLAMSDPRSAKTRPVGVADQALDLQCYRVGVPMVHTFARAVRAADEPVLPPACRQGAPCSHQPGATCLGTGRGADQRGHSQSDRRGHLAFQPDKENYLLWLGRMHETKGPHRAIAAARQAGVPLVLADRYSRARNCSSSARWTGTSMATGCAMSARSVAPEKRI